MFREFKSLKFNNLSLVAVSKALGSQNLCMSAYCPLKLGQCSKIKLIFVFQKASRAIKIPMEALYEHLSETLSHHIL